jgi:hypothetical protein
MLGRNNKSRKIGYGQKYHEEMKKESRWPNAGPIAVCGLAGARQEGHFLRTSSGKGGSVRTVWFPPEKGVRIP